MRYTLIPHALLWAAAILSGALLGAEPFYVTVCLPVLAVVALGVQSRPPGAAACRPCRAP